MQILLAQSQAARSENGETQIQPVVRLNTYFSHFDIVKDDLGHSVIMCLLRKGVFLPEVWGPSQHPE